MIGLQSGLVKIIDHQDDWSYEYQKEKTLLLTLIGKYVIDIQHIGSTSINNCKAKPIIDIAIGIRELSKVDKIINILTYNGYEYHGNAGIEGRHFFTKGVKENRTHYIHVEEKDGILWKNHIMFRDYLNKYNENVIKYNELKKCLAQKYPKDREKYALNKNEYIENIIKKAIQEVNEWRRNAQQLFQPDNAIVTVLAYAKTAPIYALQVKQMLDGRRFRGALEILTNVYICVYT